MDYVNSSFTETLGKAFADKADDLRRPDCRLGKSLRQTYAKDQGFTVS